MKLFTQIDFRLTRTAQQTPQQDSTSGMDAEFQAAYESGDVDKAKILVEQAAKAKGYDVGPVYHGPRHPGRFTEFDDRWSYFSSDKGVADRFRNETAYILDIDGKKYPLSAWEAWHLNPEPVEDTDWATGWNLVEYDDSGYATKTRKNLKMMGYIPYDSIDNAESVVMTKADNPVIEAYLNMGKNRKSRDYGGEMWNSGEGSIERHLSPDVDSFEARNIQEGGSTGNDFDEFPVATTYVVRSPGQVKSTEPFTFDDDKKLIPLSKRFDGSKKDIRY
jgi:hypothetical protein